MTYKPTPNPYEVWVTNVQDLDGRRDVVFVLDIRAEDSRVVVLSPIECQGRVVYEKVVFGMGNFLRPANEAEAKKFWGRE